MDILIKNMEMPKDGRLPLVIEPDGSVRIYIEGATDFVPCSSTAIPVPEHGDLIDRDSLVARFQHHTSHPTGYDVVSKIFDAPVVLERTT